MVSLKTTLLSEVGRTTWQPTTSPTKSFPLKRSGTESLQRGVERSHSKEEWNGVTPKRSGTESLQRGVERSHSKEEWNGVTPKRSGTESLHKEEWNGVTPGRERNNGKKEIVVNKITSNFLKSVERRVYPIPFGEQRATSRRGVEWLFVPQRGLERSKKKNLFFQRSRGRSPTKRRENKMFFFV